MTLFDIDREALASVHGGKDCGAEAMALAAARRAHQPALDAWAADVQQAGADKSKRNPNLLAEEKRLSGVAGTAFKTFTTCDAEP